MTCTCSFDQCCRNAVVVSFLPTLYVFLPPTVVANERLFLPSHADSSQTAIIAFRSMFCRLHNEIKS